MTHPKMFISYSQTNKSHRTWVYELAVELRKNGVDVILDQWNLKPGQEMYAFMESMVTDPAIKKVAVVCDKTYTEKANTRKGGVGNEVELMVNAIASNVKQDKFVALACEKDEAGNIYIPAYLKARLYIDFANKENKTESFKRLLFWAYDINYIEKPSIGVAPDEIINKLDHSVRNTIDNLNLRSNLVNQFVAIADYISHQYDYVRNFQQNKKVTGGDLRSQNIKTQKHPTTLLDIATLLPSCFERSEFFHNRIIEKLLENESTGDIQSHYLSIIVQIFNAKSCVLLSKYNPIIYVSNNEVTSDFHEVVKNEYVSLFSQNVTLKINGSISGKVTSNSIYVPLTLNSSGDDEESAGVLIVGVSEDLHVDDSIRVILNSLYTCSCGFTKLASPQELSILTYDNFKRIYNFVSETMYEKRFLLFQKQLNDIEMHFEPIVEFSSSGKAFNIYGFEALARVSRKTPTFLFETAELWGIRFQTELDLHVLNKSISQYLDSLKESKLQSYNDLMPLSVNVYPNTISREKYRDALYKKLADYKFPGHKLVLELSEKGVIYTGEDEDENLEKFIEAKEQLKRKKVKIAIDDFGVGNSSVVRVQKIMPDYVKIDRQVLLYQARIAKQMISQLVKLKDESHNPLFRVIVEGLDDETKENVSISELVNDLEVEYIQGYMLGKANSYTPKKLDKEKYEEIREELGWP